MSQNIKPISGKLTTLLAYKREGLYFILLFVFIGFVLSATQILGQSPDYNNYEIFFDLLRREGLIVVYEYRFEPGFTIVAFALISLLGSNLLVYGVIVAGPMFLKGVIIYLFSSRRTIFIVAAAFYFARYFPLYELTQLRAAGAIGFLLVAATFLWNKNWLYGLLACAAAVLFHMSAALVIPALFSQPTKRWQAITTGLGIFGLVFIGANFASTYLANYLSVFAVYQELGFGDTAPNPFSVALLLDWAMIATALIMWNRLSVLMKQIVFLEIIGMAIFYGGLDFPVIAHRFRELYSVFWVFFVADGLRLKTIMKFSTAGFALASIGLYSYFYIFSGEFFH